MISTTLRSSVLCVLLSAASAAWSGGRAQADDRSFDELRQWQAGDRILVVVLPEHLADLLADFASDGVSFEHRWRASGRGLELRPWGPWAWHPPGRGHGLGPWHHPHHPHRPHHPHHPPHAIPEAPAMAMALAGLAAMAATRRWRQRRHGGLLGL